VRVRLPRKALTLSVTLASILGCLVSLSVLTVFAIEWVAAQRTTVELLQSRTRLALALLESRVRGQLDPAREQVSFLAGLVADGRLDPADHATVGKVLLGAIAATPQIQLLTMATEDLHVVGAERQGSKVEAIDRPMMPTGVEDYRKTVARPETVAFWAPPRFLRVTGITALNIRHRLLRDGKPLGMLFASVSITELSSFLRTTVDRKEGQVHGFILYGHDEVAGYAGIENALAHLSPEHPLPQLDEIDDPVLAAIWKNPRPYLVDLPNTQTHVVAVDGRNWLFLMRPLQGYGPEPLIIGYYIPLDLVDQQLGLLRWAGLAGVGVFLLALGASILLGRALATPIRRVSAHALHIGSFELEGLETLPGSIIRELDDQSHAFNAMLSSLRWFETYVPKSLVRRLILRGDPAGIDTEERELTILFTDIVGFTTAAERMTPAGTAAFVNRHLSLVTRCIDAEAGTVDKYIGDAVMAFWNAPESQPDHADRACRAALAIRAAIEEDNRALAAQDEAPLRLRIGIHTGPVVVGNIGSPGRMNYTVVGDAVNTAQRLEALGKELAPEGEQVTILLSRMTRDKLSAPLVVLAAGRFAVKGRAQEVEVFRLLAAGKTA
jgi:class 3 adenylate cyclase